MQLKDLTPEQAQRLSALLDEALDLAPGQRDAWLGDLAQREAQLCGLVNDLLASMGAAGRQHLLETKDLIERRFAQAGLDASSLEGRVFGSYRVLRLLGQGGMGSVWLAERADGLFARQVALKLVHASLIGRALTERFARERSILAALAHPHIARLLDAGVSAEGQPYLALEYVDGTPLTAYCDAERLNVRARVSLAVQVLSAVQHAHQNLVVHRDLKPSNILVTREGQTQLLDFGIAKLMVEGEARETELTQVGGRALTLDYASPEQIAGQPITTASDVYSLGVVLYELLCGQRPYALARESRGAMEEAILNAEPVRPSQRGATEDIADARSTTPKKIARSLRGDLDTITLKALRKDPVQRYATADAFREDLQRFLDGEAVLARPDATLYRAAKFVRRHRFGVAATLLVFAALGAGLAGTAWQARLARLEVQRTQAVKDFLIGLFNQSEPMKAQGRELTAREMLDRGQHDLQAKLADQPRLNAELDGVLVELYAKLGDEAKALPLAQARCDLTLQLGGTQSLEYGDALFSLADIQGGLRRHELAYKTYMQAREVLRRYAPIRQSQLLSLEGHLAYQLAELERFKEASELLISVLPRLEAHFGPRSWEVIQNKALLSHTYSSQGDEASASAIVREIEPWLGTVDASHVLDAAVVRNNIGLAQLAAWHPDEAEKSLRDSLDVFERLLGPNTSVAVGIQRTLGMALYERGQFEQASRTFDENVQRAVRVLGADNPATRLSESYSIRALIMAGHVVEAENMGRRSVQVANRSDDGTTAVVGDFNNRLALALIFNGKAVEAGRLLEGFSEQARQTGLETSDMHGRTLLYLAGAWAVQGRLDAATHASREAEKVFAQSPIGRDMYVARAELTQALAVARAGNAISAEYLVAQAEEHLTKVSKPDHPIHLMVQLVRVEALRAAGHQAEAERLDSATRERLHATAGAVLPKVIALIF